MSRDSMLGGAMRYFLAIGLLALLLPACETNPVGIPATDDEKALVVEGLQVALPVTARTLDDLDTLPAEGLYACSEGGGWDFLQPNTGDGVRPPASGLWSYINCVEALGFPVMELGQVRAEPLEPVALGVFIISMEIETDTVFVTVRARDPLLPPCADAVVEALEFDILEGDLGSVIGASSLCLALDDVAVGGGAVTGTADGSVNNKTFSCSFTDFDVTSPSAAYLAACTYDAG